MIDDPLRHPVIRRSLAESCLKESGAVLPAGFRCRNTAFPLHFRQKALDYPPFVLQCAPIRQFQQGADGCNIHQLAGPVKPGQQRLPHLRRAAGVQQTGFCGEGLNQGHGQLQPGNIRQLRNVVERGVNMATTGVLQLEDLPLEITASQYIPRQVEPEKIEATPPAPEATSYEDWERNKIWELMQKYRANKSRIAEEMGMSRGTLYKKIRRYGL